MNCKIARKHFLSDAEVDKIKEYVPQAVGFYEHLGFTTYKRTDYDEEGNPYPLLYMKLQKKKGIHMVNIRKAEPGDEHILA